jgi:hypothetical protein
MTELTDAEKLTALDMYVKALKPHGDALRARITDDFSARKVEKLGAYLPDGTKIGSVSYRKGAVTARITDDQAALRWAMEKHPEQIMQAVRPAFLAMLLDVAKKDGIPGACGYDPADGEALEWIEIVQGPPGVTVTTTPEGKARMAEIAGNFAGTLAAAPEPAPYDAAFADRLENGAYDRSE